MNTVYDLLTRTGVTGRVVLPSEIDLTFRALEVEDPVIDRPGGIRLGYVRRLSALSRSPIPGFDFALALPNSTTRIPFKLKIDAPEDGGPVSGFALWLKLGGEEHLVPYLDFVRSMPGFVLTSAQEMTDDEGDVILKPLAGTDPPRLVLRSAEAGAELVPSLLFTGSAARPAEIRFTGDTDSRQGIVQLGLEPPVVMFGDSGIGFKLDSFSLDDSESEAALGPGGEPGVPGLDPPLQSIPADEPAWRGLIARSLTFYLPKSVPLFGGRPIRGYLAIARGATGVDLLIESVVPARTTEPKRPAYRIRIECRDPTASGLSGLVPTLISADMELPLDEEAQHHFPVESHGDQAVSFAAGRPVRLIATVTRDPVLAQDRFTVVLGVSSQGEKGVLSVVSRSFGGAKIFNIAAAMATSLIADRDVDRNAEVGDTEGVLLTGLLAAGGVLSALFQDDTSFVLHGVEIETTGTGSPIGDKVALVLDYSVAVRVVGIGIETLSVQMSEDQPMRIRIRNARLGLDLKSGSALGMVSLDFNRSTMEVEDPGHWTVEGLEQLFDVLRSRSGRGSTWFEVDLGFKADLGPISVTGATVRITLNGENPDATIRGLGASIDIPGAIQGGGSLQLLKHGGFDVSLRATVIPLHLGMYARLRREGKMLLLNLGVDLPAPVPLANSGLGLLGVRGDLAFSGRPNYDAVDAPDPLLKQLKWDPAGTDWTSQRGRSAFGFAAAIGTLPDLGFSFSARAGLMIGTPDLAIRGSLNGRVLRPPATIADQPAAAGPGTSYLGLLVVDSEAVSFGLFGLIELLPLLRVSLPMAGHFPLAAPGRDISDWYLYLGADGATRDGRQIGPISAQVLPEFIPAKADAYLMIRGHGLIDWPARRPVQSVADGLVLAFGFALQTTFGVKRLVWADLYASLDVLLGSKPLTLGGYGQAGGSLHLGPFSLGVQSQVLFLHTAGRTYFRAQVTGKIELLFFDIEGTVTIAFGDAEPPLEQIAEPDRHPLDRLDPDGRLVGTLVSLTNDRYELMAPLSEQPARAPSVSPDAIISLPFAVSPAVNPAAAGRFPGVQGPDAPPPPSPLGTEMLHYTWRVEDIRLCDVTDVADKLTGGREVPGTMAARWQVPRAGGSPATGSSDIAELMLFTPSADVWVDRLPDGGSSRPPDQRPLSPAANICEAGPPPPDLGWAIGYRASRAGAGYRLPAETVSANPMVCRVEAVLLHQALSRDVAGELRPVLLEPTTALPVPYVLEAAVLHSWPGPYELKHYFSGHLGAPCLHEESDAGTFVGQQIELVLSEEMTTVVLALLVDRSLVADPDRAVRFAVRAFGPGHPGDGSPLDPSGPMPIESFGDPRPDGYLFWASGTTTRLIVRYPLGAEVGVAGIGGQTTSAVKASEREMALREAEAKRRETSLPHGEHRRTILEPGRMYRVDVDMTWAGRLRQRDPKGGEQTLEISFEDNIAKGNIKDKHYFFRTVAAADLTTPQPAATAPDRLNWLLSFDRPFHPAMLERYLAGYRPTQGEECRFRNDPVRVHFSAGHVAALAAAFGFELRVCLRRVDEPGEDHASPAPQPSTWSHLTDPAFLGPVDRERYRAAQASSCPIPTPGATLGADDPELAPLAWYEAFAGAYRGGTLAAGLPGVVFRTSRWRVAGEMFAGIGFAVAGATTGQGLNGDLEIKDPAFALRGDAPEDDQSFDAALDALGMSPRPPVADVRLSRLWVASGTGWEFAGLLLESPEPIVRPGRVESVKLTGTDTFGRQVDFPMRRRDRYGARLLFLTGNRLPVGFFDAGGLIGLLPSLNPELTVRAEATIDGTVRGTLTLPLLPSFAGEPR